MWTGRRFSRPCSKRGYIFWKKWTRPALLSFAVVSLLILPGCSLPSSTQEVPSLPVLPTLQRLELNGAPGVWMSSSDAGRLAQWIYDVTGEAGQ